MLWLPLLSLFLNTKAKILLIRIFPGGVSLLLASTTPSLPSPHSTRSSFPPVDVRPSLFLYRRQRAFNLLAPFVVIVLLGLVRDAAQGRGKSVHSSVTALGCAVGRVIRARSSRFERLASRSSTPCHAAPQRTTPLPLAAITMIVCTEL